MFQRRWGVSASVQFYFNVTLRHLQQSTDCTDIVREAERVTIIILGVSGDNPLRSRSKQKRGGPSSHTSIHEPNYLLGPICVEGAKDITIITTTAFNVSMAMPVALFFALLSTVL